MTYLMRQTKDETMPKSAAVQAIRRATNITLPVDLLAEARMLGLNVSQACEQGLKAEIARSRGAVQIQKKKLTQT